MKSGCSLAGDTWSLTGIMLHNINISLHMATVATAPFNWSHLISHRLVHHKLQTLSWRALPEIKHVHLSYLSKDNDLTDWLVDSDQTSVNKWWPFIFLVGLSIDVGIVILMAYRCKWWCFRTALIAIPARSPEYVPPSLSAQNTFEMVPLTMTDCVATIKNHLDVVSVPT